MALELRGPEAVRGLQRFVSEYQCDEETLRQAHWKEVGTSLSDPQEVWSVDASEFPKKGEESVGVAPQYCGALGKTANCQSGVFGCYVSPKGHELVRVSEARWPIERCFQEDKGELGLDHYEHRSWTAWHRHMRLTFLAQLFLLRLRLRLKKTSTLTLPQARVLLEWSFPHPRRELDYVLALVEYHQARNDCAYRSHRKRRLKEFEGWKTLKPG